MVLVARLLMMPPGLAVLAEAGVTMASLPMVTIVLGTVLLLTAVRLLVEDTLTLLEVEGILV